MRDGWLNRLLQEVPGIESDTAYAVEWGDMLLLKGVAEADLYQRRDLMPTRDLRAYAGWIIRDLFELAPGVIERVVYPGVDLGADPRLIL